METENNGLITANREEIRIYQTEIRNIEKDMRIKITELDKIKSNINSWKSRKQYHEHHHSHLQTEINRNYTDRYLYQTEIEDDKQEIRQCDHEIRQEQPKLKKATDAVKEEKKKIRSLNKKIKRLEREIKLGKRLNTAEEDGTDNPVMEAFKYLNQFLGDDNLIFKYIILILILIGLGYILIS